MQNPTSEKVAFAERLKLSLTRSRKKINTAAELALQFNLRHPNASITQQAAQKWLSGTACPTPDKMETLADWLGVPVHWLRFGSPIEASRQRTSPKRQIKSHSDILPLAEVENRLVIQFRLLTPHQQTLINELVTQLALEQEIGAEVVNPETSVKP